MRTLVDTKMKPSWPEIENRIKKLNIQTRTEYEIRAIRLRLTLAIIEDILKFRNRKFSSNRLVIYAIGRSINSYMLYQQRALHADVVNKTIERILNG